MKIYRKEKHWDDYWEIHINFPWVGKRRHCEYGFSFPTQCYLNKEDEDYYWSFTLKILGFGATIIRQNGY